MTTVEHDVEVLVSLLLVLPVVAVMVVAIVDVLRRPDLTVVRKVAYGAVIVLVSPAALLYLLSRPTSLVRHRDRTQPDWRDDLVAHLVVRTGSPPTLGPRQEALLLEQVEARAAQAGRD